MNPQQVPDTPICVLFTDERIRAKELTLQSQTVMTGAIEELKKLGNPNLAIACRPWHEQTGFASDSTNTTLRYVSDWVGLGLIWSLPNTVFNIRQIIKSSPPIIVTALPSLNGLIAGLLFTRKSAATIRLIALNRGSLEPVRVRLAGILGPLTGLALGLAERALRTINRKADVAVYVSSSLVSDRHASNTAIAPEVDWKALEDAEAPGASRRNLVLFVGRLEEEKGPTLALKSLLQSHCGDAELWVIGEGSQRAHLEVLAAERPELKVKFLGRVPHREVLTIMAEAKAILIPSLAEGFGLVALEAALQGCWVIHSGAGGLPEALEGLEHAVQVASRDPLDWAAALEKAMSTRIDNGMTVRRSSEEIRAERGWKRFGEIIEDQMQSIRGGT